MAMTVIYGLQDPITKECRYVGKTTQTLPYRMYGHNRYKDGISHKDRWIKKVNPEIFEIDVVDDSEWQYWENFYIQYFKYIGCRLLNLAPGGGGCGKRKQETTDKIVAKNKGRKNSIESIERMSKSHMGIKPSEETRKKLSVVRKGNTNGFKKGYKPTKEQILAHSIFLKGNDYHKGVLASDETKLKMSISHTGSKRTEEQKLRQSQAAYKRWQKVREMKKNATS
jgi:hypothetical protein